MKERQRWQPEEDALLRAYVKQYGAKEWNLVSQRMGKALDRDAKSCLERWKNYLKPGIKKGSLTEEEQSLVISLQAKYGNKWKKIAAEVPGRTAKRLGKWWEVFKEKQLKEKRKERPDFCSESAGTSGIGAESGGSTGKYDHILETFAEKYVQPKLCKEGNSAGNQISSRLMTVPTPPAPPLLSETASFLAAMPDPRLALSETAPLLSLGVSKPDLMAVITSSSLPPWMSSNPQPSFVSDKDFFKQHPSVSSSCSISPSVSLSLSPSSATAEPVLSSGSASPDLLLKWVHKENAINGVVAHPLSALVQYCKELEEGRQNWFQHKKEATWRLSRLEQQLESEKARKRREKLEEIEAKIRCLREEEMAYLDKVEIDCREQLSSIQRDAELKEAKLMEQWSNKHLKLSKFVEQLGFHHFPDSLKNFNSKDFH